MFNFQTTPSQAQLAKIQNDMMPTCLEEAILTPHTTDFLGEPLAKLADGVYCGAKSKVVTVLNRATAILGLIPAVLLQVVETVLKFTLVLFAFILVLPFEMLFTNRPFVWSTAVQLLHGSVMSSIGVIAFFEMIGRCFAPGSVAPKGARSMMTSYGIILARGIAHDRVNTEFAAIIKTAKAAGTTPSTKGLADLEKLKSVVLNACYAALSGDNPVEAIKLLA